MRSPLLIRRLSLLFLCRCAELGECDADAALEVVWDTEGIPAFAGQAIVNTSCGSGSACHSEGATGADRFGAPLELDFDLEVASTSSEVEEERAALLLEHQLRMFEMRGSVYDRVASRAEPPGGAAYDAFAATAARYQRYDAGVLIGALPDVRNEGSREILRNWLACGTPVVERTEPRRDRQPNFTGFTVPMCTAAPCTCEISMVTGECQP